MSQAAYRFVKKKWSDSAFDGKGASLYGGRWNSKGSLCVYLASTPSLALLEIMVHLDDYSMLNHYHLFQVTLEDKFMMELDISDLPADWRDDPIPVSTMQIGDSWLQSNESAGLYVPSTIIPMERNILFNPLHPDAKSVINSVRKIPFEPDNRL